MSLGFRISLRPVHIEDNRLLRPLAASRARARRTAVAARSAGASTVSHHVDHLGWFWAGGAGAGRAAVAFAILASSLKTLTASSRVMKRSGWSGCGMAG